MHGSGVVSNAVASLLGGSLTAGFYLPGLQFPDPDLYLPYPADIHEIRRHLALLDHLGIEAQGEHLELPLLEEDLVRAADLLQELSLAAGQYVVLHPGAQAASRRWAPERFARIGDELAGRGFAVVVTGTQGEAGLVQAVTGAMKSRGIDLSGRTDPGALAGLLQTARFLLSSDTGVSHLAAALKVPSVVIFTATPPQGSDPMRWAPLDRRLHQPVFRSFQDVTAPGRGVLDCCLRDGCTLASRLGALPAVDITIEEVSIAVAEVLERIAGSQRTAEGEGSAESQRAAGSEGTGEGIGEAT